MSEPFIIDRAHPPARIVFRDASRTLTLRPWNLSDIDRLKRAVEESTEALKPYMPWAHEAPTREGEYALIAGFQANYWAGRDYVYGCFSDDGTVLGGAGLHARVPLNPRGLEVGYWCHSAHAGRGWTTLAAQMLTVLAFDHFACDRLQVIHTEANGASRRVVEKCGFRYEATLRGLSGQVSDKVRAGGYLGEGPHRQYALLPDDLAGLAWLDHVRAHTTFIDALGV